MKGCSQQDKDKVTPEYWLKKFMEEGIHCVAITDHNSGGWIDRLQQKLDELGSSQNKPDWYRPLYLFPGVEISANGGVHILAIFGLDKNKSDIDQLLGAVDYNGTKGKTDAETKKTVTEVIDAIARLDGIPIPAHVDQPKGLFEQLQGPTLEQVLDNPNIVAMELRDDTYIKPQVYSEKKRQWTEVRGSDTHNFRGPSFGNFTWVKMDEPSIEGLRLALIDGAASVNRNMSDSPNRHAELIIEKLKIRQAKYIGHSKSLHCRFSPFLNTIIGGRGSGKSTLLEFMRLALRREKEMPETLERESRKYFGTGDDNLLSDESQISLIYRKGEVRYRLNWSAKTGSVDLEEEKGEEWVSAPGEIRSLFPVYIYSQKEIFEVARKPRALLNIIDRAPEVDYAVFDARKRELETRYKQIEQKIQELSDKIDQENRLQGESNDLARQIGQIEKSGHKEVLQNYRERQQQLNEIERLENDWQEMSRQLMEMQDEVAPVHFNAQHFDGHADMLSALKDTNQKWQAISDKFNYLAQEAQTVVADWQAARDAAAWMQALNADMAQFEQLHTQLEQQGIDPNRYPLLLRQQRRLHRELQLIGEYRSHQGELEAEKQNVFKEIEENRKALSEKRQDFLTRVLQNNPLCQH